MKNTSQSFFKQKFGILGFGVEGQAMQHHLLRHGATDITVLDKQKLGDHYLDDLGQFDVLVRSPGVGVNHPAIQQAIQNGVIVTSVTKYFWEHCPAPIIGVTGSNGKTTTTALIGEVLQQGPRKVWISGNDRAPILEALTEMTPADLVVLELSSFQLEDLTASPEVAVVTNVTPNHLDYHPDFQSYLEAKSHILRFQKSSDLAVLNALDVNTAYLSRLTQAAVALFNTSIGEDAAFVKDGFIMVRLKNQETAIGPLADVHVKSPVGNFLAAAIVGRRYDVPPAVIMDVFRNFKGVKHRIEFLRELDGVKYYNDAACTTPESTILALEAFLPASLVVIVGGQDKKLNYELMGKKIVERQAIPVIMGQTADIIERAIHLADPAYSVQHAKTLEDAIHISQSLAKPGQSVVLSPACTSFDMFKNAKERGFLFEQIVLNLK